MAADKSFQITNVDKQMKKLVETVLITTQMLMLHANDLLDQRLIEHGKFVPAYAKGSVIAAIREIVTVFKLTLEQRSVSIEFNRVD